jgi:hypothetical protein
LISGTSLISGRLLAGEGTKSAILYMYSEIKKIKKNLKIGVTA